MKVRILVSGRGYDAAEKLPRELELPEGATLDQALAAVEARLPAGRRLEASCLIAVSGEHLGTIARHVERNLHEGDELVLIAPVAGG